MYLICRGFPAGLQLGKYADASSKRCLHLYNTVSLQVSCRYFLRVYYFMMAEPERSTQQMSLMPHMHIRATGQILQEKKAKKPDCYVWVMQVCSEGDLLQKVKICLPTETKIF